MIELLATIIVYAIIGSVGFAILLGVFSVLDDVRKSFFPDTINIPYIDEETGEMKYKKTIVR